MITLYYHPLASYCWKVLVALYEHDVPFARELVDLADPDHRARLAALWPFCKFPVLKDGDRVVAESTIIVEYLDRHHAGARRLFPDEANASLDVRLWDRVFDNYVHTPMQEIVVDRLRNAGGDTTGARRTLTTAYGMIEEQLASRSWIVGDHFSAADGAAAPALFYAATLEPFPSQCARLAAYFERLVARPSVARTLAEAKPFFASYPFASDIPARFR